MDELSFRQLESLDRRKTAVLMTIGVLEEHGPHLPISVDTIHAEELTRRLATAIASSYPDWTVLKFPTIPVGVRGTNYLGGKPSFMGSFTVRPSTLRDSLVDLGTTLAEQGFSHIFLVYAHGNPVHSEMIDQAAEFVRATRGIAMWNITGMVLADWSRSKDVAAAACLTPEQQKRLGMDIHGGPMETSVTLFLAPQLVDSKYKQLPEIYAQNLQEIVRQGNAPDWPGYWGNPAWASKHCGEVYLETRSRILSEFAIRSIKGEDLSKVPLYPRNLAGDHTTSRALQEPEAKVSSYEHDREAKLAQWLKQHEYEK